MELEREVQTVFLNDEEFISLCLTVFKNGTIPTKALWPKYYYREVTFEITCDPDEGLGIEIIE